MVGVPVFSMWLLGPSMRTFLPSPRFFRKPTKGYPAMSARMQAMTPQVSERAIGWGFIQAPGRWRFQPVVTNLGPAVVDRLSRSAHLATDTLNRLAEAQSRNVYG